MTGVWQGWLVARREMRERSRSRAFQASVVFLIVGVAALLILPALLKPSSTRDIGITGPAPAALAATIAQQARAADITARIHPYASLAAGEQAVRQGQVDVLVAGARRLEWNGQPDEQLRSMLAGAIQLATVRERAAAAGISPGSLAAVLAPVPVASVELGSVAGRGPGDEMAVLVMTVVLFFGISVFGQMVLTGELAELRAAVPDRFVDIRYRGPAPDWSRLTSATVVDAADSQVRLRVGADTNVAAVLAAVRDRADLVSFSYQPPTLSELFRQAVAA